jgi:hypothetical protein
MIEKLKSSSKTAVAIGFSYLALLGSPKGANAQWVYYPPGGWGYYRPPAVWPYRPYVVTVGTGIDIGQVDYGRLPGTWNRNIHINEIEGKRIVHNYLKRKKMGFKEDVFPRIRGTAISYLRPDFKFDFQLINGVKIEYYSPEDRLDSEDRAREFERRKLAINLELNRILEPLRWDWTLTEEQKEGVRRELTFRYLNRLGVRYEVDPNSQRGYTIPKPFDFLGKKEIYEALEARVEYIEAKRDATSIEQALEIILKEKIKGRILSEREAEEVISSYLNLKKINHKSNTIFRNGITMRCDFLVEDKTTKSQLPIAIEYWSPMDRRDRKRKERIYKKYEEMGGKFYPIEASSEEDILSDLENRILPKSEDKILPGSEGTAPPGSEDVINGTLMKE